jgi:hypothetical protein
MKTVVTNQQGKKFTFPHPETTTFVKVGFSKNGLPCYSETREKGKITFRGDFIEATHFETEFSIT